MRRLRAKKEAAQFLVQERELAIRMSQLDLANLIERQRRENAQEERGFEVARNLPDNIEELNEDSIDVFEREVLDKIMRQEIETEYEIKQSVSLLQDSDRKL